MADPLQPGGAQKLGPPRPIRAVPSTAHQSTASFNRASAAVQLVNAENRPNPVEIRPYLLRFSAGRRTARSAALD